MSLKLFQYLRWLNDVFAPPPYISNWTDLPEPCSRDLTLSPMRFVQHPVVQILRTAVDAAIHKVTSLIFRRFSDYKTRGFVQNRCSETPSFEQDEE